MADDKTVQNHWGSGHNIVADVVNFERRLFEMTDRMMEIIASKIPAGRDVGIYNTGSNVSLQMCQRLRLYLESKGFTITDFAFGGQIFPAQSKPVQINDHSWIFAIHINGDLPV